jgi:mercuric ion binding protein
MKPLISTLLLIAALTTGNAAVAAERTVTLKVDSMTCDLCGPTVRKSLERVQGVTKARVEQEKGIAIVTFDDAKTDIKALTKATTEAGYPSRLAQ